MTPCITRYSPRLLGCFSLTLRCGSRPDIRSFTRIPLSVCGNFISLLQYDQTPIQRRWLQSWEGRKITELVSLSRTEFLRTGLTVRTSVSAREGGRVIIRIGASLSMVTFLSFTNSISDILATSSTMVMFPGCTSLWTNPPECKWCSPVREFSHPLPHK